METPESKFADFKKRVVRDWTGDETAAGWQKHYKPMKEQLAQVTAALIEAAAARPGMSVLDLASGTGVPALDLARKVAPSGRVTATDLSEGMLAALRANASAEGVTNVETRFADAHALPFADGQFDLVTSRFGSMFFVEIGRALGEIRRVLKSGGRIAFMVWGAATPASYFGAAAMPFMRRLAVKPDPDGPGPLRFAEPGKLARLVEAAGFKNVEETSHELPAPFRGSPREFLAAMMEIAGPFRHAAATLSESDRQAAQEEATTNLTALYDAKIVRVTAPVLIVTGSKH
jgi:SAM-dependent methyltransferase